MTLIFFVIENEAGGVAVLAPERRVKAAQDALRRAARSARAEGKEAEADILERQAETAGDDYRQIVERTEKSAQPRTFEVRAYTYGEKLEARRAATKWADGQIENFDQDGYLLALVSASTGLPEADLLAMPPALYGYLANEVVEISEPDPAKLDFLPSSPLG